MSSLEITGYGFYLQVVAEQRDSKLQTLCLSYEKGSPICQVSIKISLVGTDLGPFEINPSPKTFYLRTLVQVKDCYKAGNHNAVCPFKNSIVEAFLNLSLKTLLNWTFAKELKTQKRPSRKMFVFKIQVDPIHTILKYGIYYDFMDR